MPEDNEGLVLDEDKQTDNSSAIDGKQTTSQDSELAIDPTKKYVVNKRTGKVVTGSQIRDVFGEVELKRKLESENAKLKEDLKRLESEFNEVKSVLERLQIQQEVSKVLKGAKSDDNIFDWGSEAEVEPEPDDLLSRIESITEKVIDKKLNKTNYDIKSLVEQEIEDKEAKRRESEYLKQVFDTTQKETIRAFKAELPDIPDDDIAEIAEKMAVVESLKNESSLAFASGDRDTGADKWRDSIALQRDIYNKLAELREEQRRLNREKERKEKLNALSLGTVSRSDEKTFGKTLNPETARLNIEQIKQRAKEVEQQLRRLRQP